MFEQLDEIDWASLNHAYGSAEDVPDLMRNLASDDEKIRQDAFWTAYGNIFHQGTRYQATAPAVPFLLEILGQPDYPDKGEVMTLLAHLVMGYDEAYVPFGFADEIEGMRSELAELRARPDEVRAEDDKDSLGWGSDEDWLSWIVSITDEVRKGVPRFIRLLGDDDPYVRIGACFVLAFLPEDVEMFGPALWEAASDDEDDIVRANALIALTLASDDDFFAEYVPQVKNWLADGEPIVQYASAIALGTRCPEDAPDAVVQILLDAVALAGTEPDEDEPEDEFDIAFFSGDYGSYASDVLAFACADDPSRVVKAVAQALPGMHTMHAHSASGTVLSMLFPQPFKGEAGDLNELQREFLGVLAESRSPWFLGDATFANFSLMMGDFGLPSSMDDLRSFLG